MGEARTVRDETLDVLRDFGLTTIFANPGSTEISFLADLPEELRFVLALHEGSVVGLATGYAIARDTPSFVLLHTTAGLGNAVSALATARVNRAPLVVLVGQQDRRHLAFEPFLAGRLHGLAGEFPVWVDQPVRAQDVPGSLARAWHESQTGRGPAIVIVPQGDWREPASESGERAAPARLLRTRGAEPGDVGELAVLVAGARSPAMVVGARADDAESWSALVRLAEHLGCPVWQESFGARAGFPQDHRLFAGHLPGDRTTLREILGAYDLVLAVGAPVFRQYTYEPGPLVPEGTRVALVTDDPVEAHRSAAELAVLGSPAAICSALVDAVPSRDSLAPASYARPDPPDPPGPGEPLRAGHVLAALAELLPSNAVVVEESPSSRPELIARIAARENLGFVSAAMGGLGFALPGSTGLRMGLPDRPVVAVVGDGSALYQIQALWSAAHYRVGALYVILSNGGYAVMDRLGDLHGGAMPWPRIDLDISALARGFGCPAIRIDGHSTLLETLDEVIPGLAARTEPLLLEIVVAPDSSFQP